jgi:radical SAM superfamily enzyme YgiQ (UPF0313 family)
MTGPVSHESAAPRVLLVSTYDLGHQPFGLASPAAWLRAEGAEVTCLDLAVEQLSEQAVRDADLVALYAPMHTATRMVTAVLPRIRRLNPAAHVCVYGLYAPMNSDHLLECGADSIVGGEFEEPLRQLLRDLHTGGLHTGGRPARPPVISLARQQFEVPDRSGLPALADYAALRLPDGQRKVSGYTEATRGCKHLCRHCPVVPVYGGRFRVVQAGTVAADIAQQVAAGATHITFGDPDFFNAPAHAMRVVRQLHTDFPALTYDVTIKIEHLLRHARYLPGLRDTGCVLVTSAVEAFDEKILRLFDKNHTMADFEQATRLMRDNSLALNPTFVAFTPWTTAEVYADFLATIHRLGLVGNVAPIQYAIRLLIPRGSKLLTLPETEKYLRGFDPQALCYRWEHPDPAMDELQADLLAMVADDAAGSPARYETFEQVRARTLAVTGEPQRRRLAALGPADVAQIPRMTEQWYCCAEPIELTPHPAERA